LHSHAIAQKVAIMVEHFAENVASQINGKAKAMIVTRSRLHAVRYKIAIDQYIKEKGYPYKSLVAFTGKVFDGGIEYTETGMNTAASGKSISERATAETFNQDSYRFLIVANKFQTGFDQPLLHTMYVDKKLGGVNAVQTLSRLNRVYPGKHDTIILDFANEAEEIQKAFEPYYEQTILSQGTHPNLLYHLQTQLGDFGFYDRRDIDNFAAEYYSTTAAQFKLHAVLDSVVERYNQATDTDRSAFRERLKEYESLYAFFSQLISFADAELEKLYEFVRYLSRKLPVSRERLPTEIQQHIELESYRIQQTFSGKIDLERDAKELDALAPNSPSTSNPENLSPLSQIIQQLNQRFGTDFSDSDKVFIEQLETKLDSNDFLKASVRINSQSLARLTFNDVVSDEIQETIETNFKFYKQFNDRPEFAEFLLNWLFERYCDRCEVG